MRTIISFVVTVIMACITFVGSLAVAEDIIVLDNKAKVGETKIFITSETLADGTRWDMETVCTKVSKSSVICITEDDLGLVESKRCRGNKCNVIASR